MVIIQDRHHLKMIERKKQQYKESIWNPPLEELDDGKNKKLSDFSRKKINYHDLLMECTNPTKNARLR